MKGLRNFQTVKLHPLPTSPIIPGIILILLEINEFNKHLTFTKKGLAKTEGTKNVRTEYR
jgi:hypothetical protein